MGKRGVGVLLPASLGRDAAVGENGHLAEIALGAGGLHVELPLFAEVGEDPGRAVAAEAAVVAAREGGEEIASLISRKVPEQLEERRVEDAVHRVGSFGGRRPHPVPPPPRPGCPRGRHEVGLHGLEGRSPPRHEAGVASEPPLEIVAVLRRVDIPHGGDRMATVRGIGGGARRAETLRPAAEAIHVVAIPVELFDELDLRLDEPFAVRRVPAPKHMEVFEFLDGDRLAAG